MSSLVLELQKEALDGKVRVSDLLRKAFVVASKLKIQDFEEWTKVELHGYTTDAMPKYRLVKGSVKAFNPYRGEWIPVMFEDVSVSNLLSQKRISQPIGQLEDLLTGKTNENLLTISFPPEILNQLKRDDDLIPQLVIGQTQVYGILEAVRNIILDWSLKLEKDGILGEGLTFSKEEQQIAAATTYTIQQNFTGPVGAVAGRDINVQVTFTDVLKKIVASLEADQKIPAEEKRTIVERLKTIAQNEWVRSIGTSVLADIIKNQ